MSLIFSRNLLALCYSSKGSVYKLLNMQFLASTNQLHQKVVEWSAKAFGGATAESILLQQVIDEERRKEVGAKASGGKKGSVEGTDEEVLKCTPNGRADIKKIVEHIFIPILTGKL